jgi:hypothetical protein
MEANGVVIAERWADRYKCILLSAAESGGEFACDEDVELARAIEELSAAEAQVAVLRAAGGTALYEMGFTTSDRAEFARAVDALDAALIQSIPREELAPCGECIGTCKGHNDAAQREDVGK